MITSGVSSLVETAVVAATGASLTGLTVMLTVAVSCRRYRRRPCR